MSDLNASLAQRPTSSPVDESTWEQAVYPRRMEILRSGHQCAEESPSALRKAIVAVNARLADTVIFLRKAEGDLDAESVRVLEALAGSLRESWESTVERHLKGLEAAGLPWTSLSLGTVRSKEALSSVQTKAITAAIQYLEACVAKLSPAVRPEPAWADDLVAGLIASARAITYTVGVSPPAKPKGEDNREWKAPLASALRLARGQESQLALAARSGVSDRTISMIEQERLNTPPRPTTVARLAIATGQDPSEWVKLTGGQLRTDEIARLRSLIEQPVAAKSGPDQFDRSAGTGSISAAAAGELARLTNTVEVLSKRIQALEEANRQDSAGTATAWSRSAKRKALALIRKGEFGSARNFLHDALKKDPQDAEAYYLLGRASEGLGASGDARQAYAQAAKLERTFKMVTADVLAGFRRERT